MRYALFLVLFLSYLKGAAQNIFNQSNQHLKFSGVSMASPLSDFIDTLKTQGYQDGLSAKWQHPVKAKSYMHGRFENLNCILEIGQSVSGGVDTLCVYFVNINNPLISYKILNNFYRSRYGKPIFDNYYAPMDYFSKAKLQLATDPFITTFSISGGIIQLGLKYDEKLNDYVYTILFVDTLNAAPIIPDDDSVIEW